MNTLEPGQLFDNRYVIIAKIGEGGMGSIYHARENDLCRDVAIKVLHGSAPLDRANLLRFEREGRLLSTLHHENIIKFYRFGVLEDPVPVPFIVMEYLTGRSLREAIDASGKIAFEKLLSIALQITSAMSLAHSVGIIHRDLTPSNIFLTEEDSVVKVLDFGLAKSIEPSNGYRTLTETGLLVGSVYYMSPEQCLGNRTDQRSDIYSLGCVFYHALTGTTPFEADNPIGLMHKQLHELPPRPSSQLSAKKTSPLALLDDVLFKALAKDPEARYQTLDELTKDLTLVSEGEKPLCASTIQQRSKKKPLLAVSILTILLVSALGSQFRSADRNFCTPEKAEHHSVRTRIRLANNESDSQKKLMQFLALANEAESGATMSSEDFSTVYQELYRAATAVGRGTSTNIIAHIQSAKSISRRKKDQSLAPVLITSALIQSSDKESLFGLVDAREALQACHQGINAFDCRIQALRLVCSARRQLLGRRHSELPPEAVAIMKSIPTGELVEESYKMLPRLRRERNWDQYILLESELHALLLECNHRKEAQQLFATTCNLLAKEAPDKCSQWLALLMAHTKEEYAAQQCAMFQSLMACHFSKTKVAQYLIESARYLFDMQRTDSVLHLAQSANELLPQSLDHEELPAKDLVCINILRQKTPRKIIVNEIIASEPSASQVLWLAYLAIRSADLGLACILLDNFQGRPRDDETRACAIEFFDLCEMTWVAGLSKQSQIKYWLHCATFFDRQQEYLYASKLKIAMLRALCSSEALQLYRQCTNYYRDPRTIEYFLSRTALAACNLARDPKVATQEIFSVLQINTPEYNPATRNALSFASELFRRMNMYNESEICLRRISRFDCRNVNRIDATTALVHLLESGGFLNEARQAFLSIDKSRVMEGSPSELASYFHLLQAETSVFKKLRQLPQAVNRADTAIKIAQQIRTLDLAQAYGTRAFVELPLENSSMSQKAMMRMSYELKRGRQSVNTNTTSETKHLLAKLQCDLYEQQHRYKELFDLIDSTRRDYESGTDGMGPEFFESASSICSRHNRGAEAIMLAQDRLRCAIALSGEESELAVKARKFLNEKIARHGHCKDNDNGKPTIGKPD